MRNFLFIVVGLLTGAQISSAVCLINISSTRIVKDLKVNRDQLRLFINKPAANGQLQWYDVPFQIDPMTESGRLLFFKNKEWQLQPLQEFDKIRFRRRDMGADKGARGLPCGKQAFEIKSKTDGKWNYAYLTACPEKPRAKVVSPIQYVKAYDKLESATYLYNYSPSNHMLFKNVFLASAGQFNQFLSDSRLNIYADVKRFFNLHFDQSDIESKIEEHDIRELGAVAAVPFFLKILFFKIRLSLTTDVNFYEDSVQIPMYISLPVGGKDHLNEGSGILYSFKIAKGVVPQSIDMPLVEAKTKGDTKPWCGYSVCSYKLSLKSSQNHMAFYFRIPLDLVKEGFYPQFVSSQKQLKALPSKYSKFMKNDDEVGFFFKTNGLSKGQHPWDFKIQFNERPGESIDCNASYDVKRL